ncbi:unnamed protein product [Caenorhabditis auriculariae]|uniref:Uncharacterized protein n=1 Tax=Caenorhabditis auriculariae TaxID=2777116 RepID=A0A8S1HUJ1_9PELO|nr:unnamed protein product [Caenorhabditis auriculariae]
MSSNRKIRTLLLIFVLYLSESPASASLSEEPPCPVGWQLTSEACVLVFVAPLTAEHAKNRCQIEGGALLDTGSNSLVEDVAEILQSLHEKGLTEPTFHVGGPGHALSRDFDGNYRLVTTNPSSAHPFVCYLDKIARRSLVIRQKLLPRGAPKITSTGQSEIYFHPRADADYIALPCAVEGSPAPIVSWYRNDVEVLTPSTSNVSYLLSGGTLLVPAHSSLSYSSFHCTAKNALGEVRGSAILLKPSFLDAFRPHRLDVYSLMNGGAKLDCDPPTHQPKSLTYSWLYASSTEKILGQDERRFISLDGTLYLSNALQEDENSYACSLSVYSTQSGHYGPFFRLIVPNSGNATFAPRLDSSQPQVFPEAPKLGESIYLECFAYGNPSPIYKWSRVDGKPLPKTAQITNFGRVLKIEKVGHSEAGRYKCVASNALGAAGGEINVKLRAPPVILQPLYDKLVPTNREFTLECLLSNADADSSVEWFKNGQPIVPLLLPVEQRKRLTIEHNVLTMIGTQKSDSGVYECMVSNDVGNTWSSALVWVKDAPPHFPPHAIPRNIFAVVGSQVTVPCVMEASPYVVGKWSDAGGARLPQKGRIRDVDGVLHIDRVLNDDSGLFFCMAQNRLGKAHAQMQLTAMDEPAVKVQADNRFVSEGTVNISCEVELNCENTTECPEALFEWRVDDRPLSRLPSFRTRVQEHMKKAGPKGRNVKQKVDLEPDHGWDSERDVYFFVAKVPKSLAGKHIGRFACASLYGGKSEAVGRSQPPSPIAVIIEKQEKGRGYRLRWRLPPQHRDTRDHSSKAEGAASRDVIAHSDLDSVTLNNLLPNTDYQFRVRSLDSSTMSEPSMPSEWIHTPSGPPSESIETLKWRPLDSQTLLVEWQPVERDYHAGDNLRYRVSWSESTSADNQTLLAADSDVLPHHLDSHLPQAVVKLNSTEGCRMVVLAVRPVNDQGDGSVSTDTIAFLNSKGQLKRAHLHNVIPINATHVNISWIWEKDSDCDAKNALQINCNSTSGEEVTVNVGHDHSHFLVGGLQADTAYECLLRAVDNHGNQGPPSRQFRIHTKQKPPTDAPEILKLNLKPSTEGYATVLEWTAVPLQMLNKSEIGCGYKIFIYISETASEAVILDMPLNRLSDRRKPSARLDGLKLMYMYTVQVAGYNPGGVGPLSDPRSIRLGSPSSLDLTSSSVLSNPPMFALICLLLVPFLR